MTRNRNGHFDSMPITREEQQARTHPGFGYIFPNVSGTLPKSKLTYLRLF
jgi:hypothetical protein